MGKNRIKPEDEEGKGRAVATRKKAASRATRSAREKDVGHSSDEELSAQRKQSVVRPKKVRSVVRVSMVQRHRMIAEAAYFLAEKRGFNPGSQLDDWLKAELAVDDWLARQGS